MGTRQVGQRVAEETVLFVSVLKWVVLGSTVGVIVGFSTTIFLKALNWGISLTGRFSYYYLLLPIGFLLSSLLVKYLAPDAKGHGTEKVIEAIHKHQGKIKTSVVPIKLLATVVTIAVGGSAGKEGPCAQIGAGLAAMLSRLLRFDATDRKKLVICGISAGFASVFGTPISGAIFGVEVLFVGNLLYDSLLPSFIAGITAYQVSSLLGVNYFHHPLNFIPVFSSAFFIKVLIAGVYFGFCAILFIEIMRLGEKLSGRLKLGAPLRGIIGGCVLVVLVLVFSKRYLGLGLDTIQGGLQGRDIIWYAFIIKIIFTSITLNFEGSGGIVTPIFFVGVTSGCLFAKLFGLDTATFAAIGMVGLLAGAANTPIAASIMAVELFGAKVAPYATVACIISFLITGHRSVYPSQILGIIKSSSINVEIGSEMDDLEVRYQPRDKSIVGKLSYLYDRITSWLAKK
ncbi:MAG: H(+)/Cl(-) exchange transporter ClcA [bacterium ADurb.Bin236]|nr:MAG: H(+)/Cl(-) exchange transporter ClcA [bacterium ADurb.Bin236]